MHAVEIEFKCVSEISLRSRCDVFVWFRSKNKRSAVGMLFDEHKKRRYLNNEAEPYGVNNICIARKQQPEKLIIPVYNDQYNQYNINTSRWTFNTLNCLYYSTETFVYTLKHYEYN